MKSENFSTTLLVNETPNEAYEAINNVRGWWSEEIEGDTDILDSEFNYHFEDIHRCKIKVTELIPGKKISWLVVDNYFNFTLDEKEWKGTKIVFNITPQGKKTQIKLTHNGLVPAYECYDICSNSWTNYMQNSLKNLITTGIGNPNATGKPQTDKEKKLRSK